MDWNENSSFSNSWKAACARCVHREIKENLNTANMRGRWLSVCRLPTDALVEQEPWLKLEGCRRAGDVARSVYSQNERLWNDHSWREADARRARSARPWHVELISM